MGVFEQLPYTNYHDLNLDWVLQQISQLKTDVNDFVSLNSIKYADPIQWDITTQYEKNTVVVDIAGDGYLSVKAVPSGISIERTEYWTLIGNFSALWGSIKDAISTEQEGHSTTATKARAVGDLVWLVNDLIEVTANMSIGTAYALGTNCRAYSMQILLTELQTAINANIAAISSEAATRAAADTTNANAITAEAATREAADNLKAPLNSPTFTGVPKAPTPSTEDKTEKIATTEFVDALIIAKNVGNNVKDFGAKGDGVTNDTTAFQNAIDDAISNNKCVIIPTGNYILNPLTITDRISVFGMGGKSKLIYTGSGVLFTISYTNGSFPNSQFENFDIELGVNSSGIDAHSGEAITFRNVNIQLPGYHSGVTPSATMYGIKSGAESYIINCQFENLGNGIIVERQNLTLTDSFLSGCKIGVLLHEESNFFNSDLFFLCEKGISTEGATKGIIIIFINNCIFDTCIYYGIYLGSNALSWTLTGCWISNTGGSLTSAPPNPPCGIYGSGYLFSLWRMSNCSIGLSEQSGYGVYLDSTANGGGYIFTGNFFTNNRADAVFLNNCDGATFTGNHFTNNSNYAIRGTNLTLINITGGLVFGNGDGVTHWNLPSGCYKISNVDNYNKTTITPPANPLVAGTVYQNNNPFPVVLTVLARVTTAGSSGNLIVAYGSTSTPSGQYQAVINQNTTASIVDQIIIFVPAWWYYKFTDGGNGTIVGSSIMAIC